MNVELECKESWVLKNWCFWTVVLKTLESPLDSKEIQPVYSKGNQSWYSLERLRLKPKCQYFGRLMRRTDSLEKTLMLGKIEGGGEGDDRGWDGWMASPMRWIWIYVDSRSWWWTGRPGMLQSLWSQRVGHDWVTELNWYLCLDDAHMGNDFVGKWLLMTWVFIADGTSWFLEMWPKGRASREGEWLRMESWRLPLAPHTSGLMGMVLIG